MLSYEFKTLGNDIVFKNIFFKDEKLLKWFLNRTFKILNLDYTIDNFNIRNGELVSDKVYLKSRLLDILIEDDNFIYNIEVNNNFNQETIIRNYLYQIHYLLFIVKKGKKYRDSIKPVIQINYNLSTPKNYNYNGKYNDIDINKLQEYVFLKEIINI